jgi:uncharacterized membrane protein YgcG
MPGESASQDEARSRQVLFWFVLLTAASVVVYWVVVSIRRVRDDGGEFSSIPVVPGLMAFQSLVLAVVAIRNSKVSRRNGLWLAVVLVVSLWWLFFSL